MLSKSNKKSKLSDRSRSHSKSKSLMPKRNNSRSKTPTPAKKSTLMEPQSSKSQAKTPGPSGRSNTQKPHFAHVSLSYEFPSTKPVVMKGNEKSKNRKKGGRRNNRKTSSKKGAQSGGAAAVTVTRTGTKQVPKRINNNDGSYSVIFNARPFGLTLDPFIVPNDNKSNKSQKRSLLKSFSLHSDPNKNNNDNKDGTGCVVISTSNDVGNLVSIGSKIISVNRENTETALFSKILNLCGNATLPCIVQFRDISVSKEDILDDYGSEISISETSESMSISTVASSNAVGKPRPYSGRAGKRKNSNSSITTDSSHIIIVATSNEDNAKVLDSLAGMSLIKKAEKAEKNKKWALAIEV